MKNVKKLLMFIIVGTFLFASAQRVTSLGGNVGYWADDDNSWTAFPHTINNSNLAQVAGLGVAGGHEAIVRWGDGTKWGFSWNQANSNDMVNLQWGNGTYGVTAGVSMWADDDGIAKAAGGDNADAMSSMGLSASFGMEQDFGEIGVGFGQWSRDNGDGATDQPSTMELWFNLRRPQEVWLFNNMLVNFEYGTANNTADANTGTADAQASITLAASFYSHLDVSDNTTALIAMGFGYMDVASVGNVKDAKSNIIALPTWKFAVESAMTDWATCRMGITAGYYLSETTNAGGGAVDETGRGGATTSFNVGLGFNYGSFNLDMGVNENLFTNPVQHVTGYQPINDDTATATLTYVW